MTIPSNKSILGLDGHDGSGKSTLATLLAQELGGICVRPFAGETGESLLAAARANDSAAVIDVGHRAIEQSVDSAPEQIPLVLDRSWMTVASLVPWEVFVEAWQTWIPTALCWADLNVTLQRLGERTEADRFYESHTYYLDAYRVLAKRTDSLIVRTDQGSIAQCLLRLRKWTKHKQS